MFYLVNRSSRELTCFPAIPTMARETGLSERTVQRALKELCEEGYISRRQRFRKNGGQSSNLYVLLFPPQVSPGR
jgi:DNA-binding transcriptional MocR family regulator